MQGNKIPFSHSHFSSSEKLKFLSGFFAKRRVNSFRLTLKKRAQSYHTRLLFFIVKKLKNARVRRRRLVVVMRVNRLCVAVLS